MFCSRLMALRGLQPLGTWWDVIPAEAGATVVISSSRDQESAEEAAARLPCPGGATHHGIKFDQVDPISLEQGFADAITTAGKVDILVNNGLVFPQEGWSDVSFEQFASGQDNNAAYFCLARLTRNHAVQRNTPASIIMIGSMYGQVGSYPDMYEDIWYDSPVAYPALKGGHDSHDPPLGRVLGP